ncbi:MAG TPA: 50S ribosomal protein L7ae [Lachnospiraceae bacterium]|nr:ribosomal L7Ae/L30e/S12e/Gadd45 family protein [uncultured Lachnoclostridium sp.]HAU84839.1 50S ribosomal protein L7ae [Lachnospiraceae bacterium]
MNKIKTLSYVGLGIKSRNVECGEFLTEKAVKENRAYLVIVAEDASQNTKKKFTNMCEWYKVPIYFIATKEELGHAMGKEMRASLAFTDQGLARAVEKQLL